MLGYIKGSCYTYLILTHLYSLISSTLQILSPHQIPKPLQIRTSKITESHQHSKKLGNKWANAISVISHITDMAHSSPACRNSKALNNHPRKWPQANTSTWDQIFAIDMSEQLTAYSWKIKTFLQIQEPNISKHNHAAISKCASPPYPCQYGSSSALDQSSTWFRKL